MKTLTTIALRSFSLAFLVALPLSSKGADQYATVKEELIKLEKQSWEAWKNHDGKFFETFLSDDHVEVGSGGVFTKAPIVKTVTSGVCEVKSFTLDHFELRILADNTALLTYYEAQDTDCQGKAVHSPCWVGSLYMKRDGRWLNIFYQQTPEAK